MMHKYLLTLTCQTETPGVLLALVVAYPRGFLIQMIFFFIFGPCGFYLDCGFSKVPGDVFIRKIFPYYPCGSSDIIVVHLAPVGFIQPVVLKK